MCATKCAQNLWAHKKRGHVFVGIFGEQTSRAFPALKFAMAKAPEVPTMKPMIFQGQTDIETSTWNFYSKELTH